MAKTKQVDDFDAIANLLEESSKPSKGKKKNKPNIELTEAEKKLFDAFCAADVIAKMAKGKSDTAQSLIKPILRRKLMEKWLETEHKTDNPTIITENARANFVVRDILKVDVPDKDNGEPGSVLDRLLEAGFDEEEAEVIFKREFTEKKDINFRNLRDLRDGTPEESAAVKKLLKLVRDEFSPQEQKMLLKKETKVEVNEGFMDRAIKHAADSIEKLDALLTVVQPQWVLSHMNFSGADLHSIFNNATGGELQTTTVESKPEEFYSADKLWKATCKGTEALLYKCSDSVEKLIGVKQCKGGIDHARSTCKKWLREENYRNQFIAECVTKK